MPEYTKTCPYCKKQFTTNRSNKYYCSPSCRTMASRKGHNQYEYPNQLEIGLKRSIKDLAGQLITFEEDIISIRDIIKLQAKCEIIRAFTLELVNPENKYYKCFLEVIEPLINNKIELPLLHRSHIKLYSDQSKEQFFDYSTLELTVELKIPGEDHNRLYEIYN